MFRYFDTMLEVKVSEMSVLASRPTWHDSQGLPRSCLANSCQFLQIDHNNLFPYGFNVIHAKGLQRTTQLTHNINHNFQHNRTFSVTIKVKAAMSDIVAQHITED